MKKKKVITIISVIAVIAIISVRLVANKQTIIGRAENAVESQHYDAIPVKTVLVKEREISDQIVQSGTFTPQQDLKLLAQSQGQIKSLLVKKTQIIYKGALLATIDNSSLSSQLATANASLDKAKQDAQRFKNAFQSGGVTQQQVEDADLRVKNSQTQVTQLLQQMDNYKIVAPVSGVINDIYVESGSFVSPGTAVLEIVDIMKVNLKVRINQESLPDIKLGQKVKVTTDVYPGKIFDGKVETVNVKTDASQKIEVGVVVENTKETPLLSGMYGHAEFMTDSHTKIEKIISIPREAIIGSTQDAKVFIQKADSTVTLRSIATGRILDSSVEVLQGLTPNEWVVTTGQINLEEGKRIIVKNN
jgi:membrane fusion protein, multidrug efflux system